MSYLDRKDYETYGNACIHGEKPPCVCGCPLNIDIPKIAENLQGGRISAAYRTFRDQALFPAIVSRICDAPCGGVCVRNDKDSPVEIKLLEQAIVAHTENREPNRFNLPAKNRKIAIIGGGLAGLSVAVFMGTKNYEVTVYEGADQPGGRLRHMLAPEDYLAEIALQLKYANCTIEINSPIKTLDDLTFDAAFIGTGAGGHDFGLAAGVDRKGFGTAREGVFLGGALLGAAPVEDIAQAFTAAYSMEKYLKIGKMDGIPETFRVTESVITKDPESYAETGVVLPAASEGYTKEEATAEANRCLKCDCTLCSDACQLFGFFDRMPAQISQEAFSSLHTKKSLTKQNAMHQVASCTLCGLCGKVCPKNIDVGKIAYDFRYFKTQDKMYPKGYSDFFVRDMNFSNTEAWLQDQGPGEGAVTHLYFPGCQLGASDPRYVEKSYTWLLEKHENTAILLGCCGAPADWGAEEAQNQMAVDAIGKAWESYGRPVMVCACPTCIRQFQRFLPEIPCVSLYEIMAGMLPKTDRRHRYEGQMFSIFDPCSSRENPGLQSGVREMVGSMAFQWEELPWSRDKAQCCSFGGNVAGANRTLSDLMVKSRIEESDNVFINYCTNCRDYFAEAGKACYHILDLLFGLDKEGYRPPDPSARRRNRLAARDGVLNMLGRERPVGREEAPAMNMTILPEAREKMRKQLILEEEVEKAVVYLNETGNTVYDQGRDCYCGYLQLGIITYWVEYRREGEALIVRSVWSHRIQILDASRETAPPV